MKGGSMTDKDIEKELIDKFSNSLTMDYDEEDDSSDRRPKWEKDYPHFVEVKKES